MKVQLKLMLFALVVVILLTKITRSIEVEAEAGAFLKKKRKGFNNLPILHNILRVNHWIKTKFCDSKMKLSRVKYLTVQKQRCLTMKILL